MKTKLTLTIDPEVTHRAKSLARKQGRSLSQLVEDLLANQTGQIRAKEEIPFSIRWAGRMELSRKDDTRYRKLKEKYHLTEPK